MTARRHAVAGTLMPFGARGGADGRALRDPLPVIIAGRLDPGSGTLLLPEGVIVVSAGLR